MTDEKLIEATERLEQCLTNREAGIGAWSMVRPEDVRTVLDALAVFEKAHTPTDDEREAITDEALWDFADSLLDAWNIEDQNPPSLAEDFRDRFVARFRRTEVEHS